MARNGTGWRFADFVNGIGSTFRAVEWLGASRKVFFEILHGGKIVGGFIVFQGPLLLGSIDQPQIIYAYVFLSGVPRFYEIRNRDRGHHGNQKDRQANGNVTGDKPSQREALAFQRACRTLDSAVRHVATNHRGDRE